MSASTTELATLGLSISSRMKSVQKPLHCLFQFNRYGENYCEQKTQKYSMSTFVSRPHLWFTGNMAVTTTTRVSTKPLPDRQCKIPGVAPTGASKETAIEPTIQQKVLCVKARDVGMEPSERTTDHDYHPRHHLCLYKTRITVIS
jgi:hypothetical protein